ncbi:MAG: DUF4159 domain-containing protein [bacterium]
MKRHRTLALALAVALPAAAQQGDAIEVASLIYGGSKTSKCFSAEFLRALSRDSTVHCRHRFTPARLGTGDVFRFPFAIMTGEGAFSLTEAERMNLRRYLERGGFLLASAGCSSKAWDASFRREFAVVFPNRRLDHIPLSHPVFRTVYKVNSLATKREAARLVGMTLGGKLVLIYSSDGLNDTGSVRGCCCCGGNELRNSRTINANILAYALLQ